MEGASRRISQGDGRKRRKKGSSSDEDSSSDDFERRLKQPKHAESQGRSGQYDYRRTKEKRIPEEQKRRDKNDTLERQVQSLCSTSGKDRDRRTSYRSDSPEDKKYESRKRKSRGTSSSDFSSSMSSGSDSSCDRRKHKHSKKKKSKKASKKKKKSSHKGPVQLSEYMQQRSSVTGEVIKRKIKKSSRDKEREKNRKSLLDFLNSSMS